MAEGGTSQCGDGLSIASGSEFVFDFFCELCRDDDLNAEAAGFCKDCREYLCNSCIHAHKKSRPTRYHDVLDQASMPKDTPLSQDRVSKDISTKCQVHSNKMVEFFCLVHNVLGCSTCFATEHRNCAKIESISDKAETIFESEDYKKFVGNLEDMRQMSNDLITNKHCFVSSLEQDCINAVGDIRKFKEDVIVILEELEQELIAKVENIASSSKETCERLEKEVTDLARKIDSITSKFQRLVTSKRTCQLYVEMRDMASEASSLEEKLNAVTKESTEISGFKFKPKTDIKNVIGASGLGNILLLNDWEEKQNAVVFNNDKNTTATHVTDIDVTSKSDTSICYINGSVVLSDNALILVDSNNQSVKHVDTSTNKLKSELKVSEKPFDVAMINDKQVAVSTWGMGKIFLLNVTVDGLSFDREIFVEKDCRGVAVRGDMLLVTNYAKKKIDIMDFQGFFIKQLKKNRDGSELLRGPRHICVGNNSDDIYLSDCTKEYGNDKVIRLSSENNVKSVYCNLRDARKMCVDNDGYVYIADGDSRNIHMATADCCNVKTLLTRADGLSNEVAAVSHCNRTNKLFVGMNGSNLVKVFQLA